jgi:hypothetical protein
MMKKNKHMIFRVSPKERKLIEANAAKADMKISEYLRFVAIHTEEVKIEPIQKKERSFLDLENIFE